MNYMTFSKLNKQNIINCFTYKPYNFKDIPTSDSEYKKLEKDLGNTFNKIIKAKQEHTNIVKVVDESNINDEFIGVDGLITNLKNVAIVTTIADCQGILIYDKENKVIGNVHSGWKGTLGRIVLNALKVMKEKFDSNYENIEVYFCPSILKECFEVDIDLKEQFEKEFSDIDISKYIFTGEIKNGKQKYFIDTIGINKEVIMKLGIKESNIELSNICSKCNSDHIHSYRDNHNCGRNLALICIKEDL